MCDPQTEPCNGLSSSRVFQFQSMISCGVVVNGRRVYKIYSEFFGSEVEVFTAVSDGLGRPLVRPSILANKLNWSASRLGMILSRSKNTDDGIYQSIGFIDKPESTCRLKNGTYFISLETCRAIELKHTRIRHEQNSYRGSHAECPVPSPSHWYDVSSAPRVPEFQPYLLYLPTEHQNYVVNRATNNTERSNLLYQTTISMDKGTSIPYHYSSSGVINYQTKLC